ncbi:hypothetical protein TKK_0014565 [Trichogramma kaykai]
MGHFSPKLSLYLTGQWWCLRSVQRGGGVVSRRISHHTGGGDPLGSAGCAADFSAEAGALRFGDGGGVVAARRYLRSLRSARCSRIRWCICSSLAAATYSWKVMVDGGGSGLASWCSVGRGDMEGVGRGQLTE